MKLLFDENLSRRLAEFVQELFPSSIHVTQVGLSSGTSDREIWNYAKQNGFAIITADRDFVLMANTYGHPPKVILLENCDYPTDIAARLISSNAIRISQFARNNLPMLILRRQ
jgi:predicted nuclease of predicted toxin-antitoxin system